MADVNPFARIATQYAHVSGDERERIITRAIGETIPFVCTAGCAIDAYTPERVAVRVRDRETVHNHVGRVHAAAVALLAETATGLVVALNLTPPAVPLLRSMDLDYQRVAEGGVRAEATLSDDEQTRIAERPIGKIDVPIRCVDDAGETCAEGTLQWAWLPEDRV
jgi:acyl-coenzyme A thioesterase PaaI-like protein